MGALKAMMMLLGALAVLMTGAVPASAMGDHASAPPCHEAAAHRGDPADPSPASDKAMKAMDCCMACVTAPVLRPPERARATPLRPAVVASPAALPAGERPGPEPHPPRRPLS